MPKEGFHFEIIPFGQGSVERWTSQEAQPTRLPDGSWLRYYLCTEMDCPTSSSGG